LKTLANLDIYIFKLSISEDEKSHRTNISVPGHRKKMHLKPLKSDADVVMFDLEDSVPTDQKELSRKTIINTLGKLKPCSKKITVRVNAVDTHFSYKIKISSMLSGLPAISSIQLS
jgi:citrate lyase beta subunit